MDMEERRLEEESGEAGAEQVAGEREQLNRDDLLKALQDALDGSRAVKSPSEEEILYEDTSDGEETSHENGKSRRGINDEVVEGLKLEIEGLKNELAAARADLYNFRQRTERDRIKNRKLIAEDKTAEFLPVLDNLDRALCVPEEGNAKDVLVGVRMVQRQFLSVLENSGVTVIPTEGCCFDPLLHDAVETEYVEDPRQEGAILCELLRGYRTQERVLRPAQVRVGKLRT